ncbi:hypothetical protein Cgig2_019198 [Carnegiea gigantea]|uniref:Uncharacterized protein n=1 Tax=Carnegiea gigantea TaxID=171969 RepID=A0A9Q1QBP3_9CARY|nr:hypothetical protein Cgig2_019198 [Carnegiea gigantea]
MFSVSMRSLWLLIATCVHLIRSMVNWHTNLCWRFILWTVNITTLPVRALAALHREKMMERLMQDMQGELQNLILDNKMLEGHLQISIKEHRLMESMLSELEEDLDKAIEKIELLETEVRIALSSPQIFAIQVQSVPVEQTFEVLEFFSLSYSDSTAPRAVTNQQGREPETFHSGKTSLWQQIGHGREPETFHSSKQN